MRIRVLELPLETVGEVTSTPFMLIVDRAPSTALFTDMPRFQEISLAAGARTVLVTTEEVEFD